MYIHYIFIFLSRSAMPTPSFTPSMRAYRHDLLDVTRIIRALDMAAMHTYVSDKERAKEGGKRDEKDIKGVRGFEFFGCCLFLCGLVVPMQYAHIRAGALQCALAGLHMLMTFSAAAAHTSCGASVAGCNAQCV